jgi:Sortase and related acyltransferases
MEALIAEARRDGRAVMVAAIGLPNEPSCALHARFGFREVGTLRGIGRKFGRSLDLLLMQKDL